MTDKTGFSINEQPQFFSVSLVKPAPCEACKGAVIPADKLHWKCTNPECPQFGVFVHTGVYPIASALGEGVDK